MIKRKLLILSAIGLVVSVVLMSSWRQHFVRGSTMGTSYSVSVFLPGVIPRLINQTIPDMSQVKTKIEQRLHSVNQSMSTYIKDSEISIFNGQPSDPHVCYPVSTALLDVLVIAQNLYRRTDGLFDVTVGPLLDLWGFGGKSTNQLTLPGSKLSNTLEWRPPSSSSVQQLLTRVGFDKLRIRSGDSCVIKLAALEIDVSSIAKGFAVDLIAQDLQQLGLQNFLIEIGGEVYASGEKKPIRPWLPATPWLLLIEAPVEAIVPDLSKLPKVVRQPLAVAQQGIATSGNYRNYYEFEDVQYSHILDPKNGRPIATDIVDSISSVTVVHNSTAYADG